MVERKTFSQLLRDIGPDVGGLMFVLLYNVTIGRLSSVWNILTLGLAIMQSLMRKISRLYDHLQDTYAINNLIKFFYKFETLGLVIFLFITIFFHDLQSIMVITVVFVLIHGFNLSNVPLIEIEDLDEDQVTIKFLEPTLGKLFSITPILYFFTFRESRIRSLNLLYYQFFNLCLLVFYLTYLIIPWLDYNFEIVDLLISTMIVVSLFFNIRNVYLRSLMDKE